MFYTSFFMFKIDLHLLDEKLFLIFLGKIHDAIICVNRQNARNDAYVRVIRMRYKVKPVSDFNDSLAMKVSDIPNNSVSGCSRD